MRTLLSAVAVFTLATSVFAVTGCAADTTGEEDESVSDVVDAEDNTGTSEEALTSTAKTFVGTWTNGTARGTDYNMYYSKLVFEANGRYTGEIADPRIRCVRAPCVLKDSGTWNGYNYRGELRMRLTSPRYGRKIYQAGIAKSLPEQLTLSRNGTTVTLKKDRVLGCMVVRCSATTHCEDNNGTTAGVCVPNNTCANVRCAAGTYCEDGGGTQPPACIPNAGCALLDCAPGFVCEETNGRGACIPAPACRKTGCSSHICADRDMMTTCEFRPEYACYAAATCERGADGTCGFRKTAALTSCLANPGGN